MTPQSTYTIRLNVYPQIVPTETADGISGRKHIVQMNTPNVVMTDAICGTLAHFNWTQIAVLTVEGQWGKAQCIFMF